MTYYCLNRGNKDMRTSNFIEIIKGINALNYLEHSEKKFEFAVANKIDVIQGRVIIDKKENLVVYANDKRVWCIDPDCMELYDTIRRVSLYFNCMDDSEYYIYD